MKCLYLTLSPAKDLVDLILHFLPQLYTRVTSLTSAELTFIYSSLQEESGQNKNMTMRGLHVLLSFSIVRSITS